MHGSTYARGSLVPLAGDLSYQFAGPSADVSLLALAKAASKQVAYGLAGSWLSSTSSAEDAALFQSTASNNTAAYLIAGYWLAVAARVARSRSLAARASAFVTQGNLNLANPITAVTTSVFYGSISPIFKNAAAFAKPYNIEIASRLESFASQSAILARRSEVAPTTINPIDDWQVRRDQAKKYLPYVGVTVAALVLARYLSRRRRK